MTEEPQGKNSFHLQYAKYSEVETKCGCLLHGQQMISIFLKCIKHNNMKQWFENGKPTPVAKTAEAPFPFPSPPITIPSS